MESANSEFLGRVPQAKLDGDDPLPHVGKRVTDYWSWAYSNVLENVQRGKYAEYLVATALGIDHIQTESWAGYDLKYGEFKLEVKSSAFLQAWKQRSFSRISFGIGPKIQFDPAGAPKADPRRVADCYVFCVFGDKIPATASVLDASRWYFYVVPTAALIRQCGARKSASEARIQAGTNGVRYHNLRKEIDAIRDGIYVAKRVAQVLNVRRKAAARTYVVWERGTRRNPVILRLRTRKKRASWRDRMTKLRDSAGSLPRNPSRLHEQESTLRMELASYAYSARDVQLNL